MNLGGVAIVNVTSKHSNAVDHAGSVASTGLIQSQNAPVRLPARAYMVVRPGPGPKRPVLHSPYELGQ